MLDAAKLSELVTIAFEAMECEISKSRFLTDKSYTIVETRKRLTLVMEAIKKEPECVDIDTLRYVVYLGMASYRFFENSPLENALSDIHSFFYREVPSFRDLDLKSL